MKKRETVKIGNQNVNIEIIRSKRKTISLCIKETGIVEVRCGLFTDEKFIYDFINEKSEWIMKSIQKQKNRNNRICTGTNGKTVTWLGEIYPVHIKRGTVNKLEMKERIFEFTVKEISSDSINQLFYKASGKKLAEMVNAKRKELDKCVCIKNGYQIPRITLKYMTSRWGSCTPDKAHISLSIRLIHFPPECLEYVMVHEYCHFLVRNHSRDFYNEVKKIMPEYKKAVEKLK